MGISIQKMKGKTKSIVFLLFLIFLVVALNLDFILTNIQLLSFKYTFLNHIKKIKNERTIKTLKYYCIAEVKENKIEKWSGNSCFFIKDSNSNVLINDTGIFVLNKSGEKLFFAPLILYDTFHKKVYDFFKPFKIFKDKVEYIVLDKKPDEKFLKPVEGYKKFIVDSSSGIYAVLRIPKLKKEQKGHLIIEIFIFFVLTSIIVLFLMASYELKLFRLILALFPLWVFISNFTYLSSVFQIVLFAIFLKKTFLFKEEKKTLILLIVSIVFIIPTGFNISLALFFSYISFILLKRKNLVLLSLVAFSLILVLSAVNIYIYQKTNQHRIKKIHMEISNLFSQIEKLSNEGINDLYTLSRKFIHYGIIPPPTTIVCKGGKTIDYFSLFLPYQPRICEKIRKKERFFFSEVSGVQGYFFKKNIKNLDVYFFLRKEDIGAWLSSKGIKNIEVSNRRHKSSSVYYGPIIIEVDSKKGFLENLFTKIFFVILIPLFFSFLFKEVYQLKNDEFSRLKMKYLILSIGLPFVLIMLSYYFSSVTIKEAVFNEKSIETKKNSEIYSKTIESLEKKIYDPVQVAFELYSFGIKNTVVYEDKKISAVFYYPQEFISPVIPFEIYKELKTKKTFIKETDEKTYLFKKSKYNDSYYQIELWRKSNNKNFFIKLFMVLFLLYSLSVLFIIFFFKKISHKIGILYDNFKMLSQGEIVKIDYSEKDDFREIFSVYNSLSEKFKSLKYRLKELAEKEVALAVSRKTAHEIKNPLTPVKLNLNYLLKLKNRDREKFIKEFDELIPLILEELKKIEKVSRDLLLFAKGEKKPLKPVKIKNVVDKVINLFKGYEVEFKVDLDEGAVVLADESFCEIVLKNLILNSIEAMEDEKIVEIKGKRKNGFYELRIRDYGKGIPEDELNKVFKTGFSKKGGSGLGLAIARDLIERMGGKIDVVSWEGKGTLFMIELKIEEARDE